MTNNDQSVTNEVETENTASVSEPYIMYPESVIANIVTQLNAVNVTGLDNILKISNVYQALSTAGQKIPVNVK